MDNRQYWSDRYEQIKRTMERDERKVKKKLDAYYKSTAAQLDKELAALYQQIGKDNIIEYRRLLEALPPEDVQLLMRKMDAFALKYPQYAHLLPVRENIYKVDRLEGLRSSIRISMLEAGAFEEETIREHLSGVLWRFNILDGDTISELLNSAWADGKNFSERIWANKEKLSQYLGTDFVQAAIRGTAYAKITKQICDRFGKVSRKDAYRLVYTEGTRIIEEANARQFENDFEYYSFNIHDDNACDICKAINGEKYKFSEREPGVNFPPMHAYCKCHFEIVVPDDYINNG